MHYGKSGSHFKRHLCSSPHLWVGHRATATQGGEGHTGVYHTQHLDHCQVGGQNTGHCTGGQNTGHCTGGQNTGGRRTHWCLPHTAPWPLSGRWTEHRSLYRWTEHTGHCTGGLNTQVTVQVGEGHTGVHHPQHLDHCQVGGQTKQNTQVTSAIASGLASCLELMWNTCFHKYSLVCTIWNNSARKVKKRYLFNINHNSWNKFFIFVLFFWMVTFFIFYYYFFFNYCVFILGKGSLLSMIQRCQPFRFGQKIFRST